MHGAFAVRRVSVPVWQRPCATAEAVHVVNEFVQPVSLIASHADERAIDGGKLRTGNQGTMTFDATAACTSRC